MYKKIRLASEKESGYHGWKTMKTNLNFTEKEINEMPATRQSVQGVTMRFALISAQPNEPFCLNYAT